MTSISACFKIHGTPKETQQSIRQLIQDHKDSGSGNPALDALNDMIKMAEASRKTIASRIEAAGGTFPSYGSQAGQKPEANNEPETLLSPEGAVDDNLVADSFGTASGKDTLPGEAGGRVVRLADFFVQEYAAHGWDYPSITGARKAVADRFGVEIDNSLTKTIDEAIEYAVVKISRDMYGAGLFNSLKQSAMFERFVRLYEQQPRLGTRTSDSIRNQAYSTPAPIAALANMLAGLKQQRSVTVYEPTAGTGMLLMGADPDSVIANEMDPTRISILKDQYGNVFEGNALDVTFDGKADVVITNPPFGKVLDDDGNATPFEVDGFTTKEIDQAITLHALGKMTDDGRAVLIIGGLNKQIPNDERAAAYNRSGKRKYFEKLYSDYNVVDHFTISGDLYNKQGAGWPIDVIVIDGRGRSEKAMPNFKAPPVYHSFEEIGARIREIENKAQANFGVDATRSEQEAASPVRGPRTVSTGNPFASVGADHGATGGEGVRSGQEGSGGRAGSSPRSDEQTGPDRPSALRGPGTGVESVGEDRADSGRQPGAEGVSEAGVEERRGADGNTGGSGAAGKSDDVRVAGGSGSGSGREVIASKGQAHYVPTSQGEAIGTLVPQNMAAPLRDALETLAEKHGSVDHFVLKSLKYDSLDALHNAFSAEQIDAIALALDNLQNGNGFILGDQTGIGKGRVVAAMIRYAHKEGKIPVFMTEKQALYADMYRDMIDIGFSPDIVNEIMQTNSDKIILDGDNGVELNSPSKWAATLGSTEGLPTVGKHEKKIVFTTYDQLNIQFERGQGDRPAPRRRFLQQLMSNRQVVLIMDEAHNAGGSGDLEGLRPDPKTGIIPHPRALLMRQLIPQADGVIYSSATYAKNPDVMDLYSATDLRLGVGGDISALAQAVTSGGIPFQQITAGMLTKSGQYIRRERSFEGVTYQPLTMDVDTKIAEDVSMSMAAIREFEDMYVMPAFEADGEASGLNSVGGVGEKAQTFTSLMHNIVDQMLLALKVKPSVEKAIAILKAGRDNHEQVVLTVANTMGAFIEQHAAAHNLNEGDQIDARFNDLLYRYLYNTRLYTTDARDDKGEKIKFWLTDDELGPDGVAAYERLVKIIQNLKLDALPVSPVDFMLNELSKAGFPGLEITGRDLGIDYSGERPTLKRRDPFDRTVNGKIATIKKFNTGKNRVIILNRSGSTGISLHASERNPVEGQGKRTMIVVQAEKDINAHMQMLGRTHRTGQVVTPAYLQAVAKIPAEMKPAALLLAKMSSLSANTTADADSLFADKSTVNFLNKYGDRVAAEMLAANPALNNILGNPLTFSDKGLPENIQGLVKKVTGRLPLLKVDQQEAVLDGLVEAYQDLISELDSIGRNDLEAKTYELDARTLEEYEVSPKVGESPFQGQAVAERVDMKVIGKPFKTEEVKRFLEENNGNGDDAAREAMVAFAHYRESAIAKAQSRIDNAENDNARTGATAAMEKLVRELESDLSAFTRLNDLFAVGTPIMARLDPDSQPLTGFVIDKMKKGNPANPLALSTWRVKIAVTDGIRVVNLPFSRFNPPGGTELQGRINLPDWRPDREGLLRKFDQAANTSRQTRWIVTGNLFTGYTTFRESRGQIIHFTRDNGEVAQGVLMPESFNPKEVMASAPVTFETKEQVKRFLEGQDMAIIKLRQPGDLRIVMDKQGNMRISTHKAVAKAGRFFRDDRELLSITGSFILRSDRMVTDDLSMDDILKVFDLFQARGNSWFTDAGIDDARKITNENPKLSKANEPLAAGVAADVKAEIEAAGAQALTESGAMEIVSPEEATRIATGEDAHVKYAKDGRIQGIASKGKVYLVQGGIRRGEAWNVLVHEAGVHVGQAMANEKEFQSILAMVAARRDEQSATGEAIRKAFAAVPRDTNPEHIVEEALAYLVQAHPEATMVRRVIALVKRMLVKLGMPVNIFSAADLRALAEVAVRVKVIEAENKLVAKNAGDNIVRGDEKQSPKGETDDSKYSIESGRITARAGTPRIHAGQGPALSETERADKIAELEGAEFYDNYRRGGGGYTFDPLDTKARHTPATGRGLADDEIVANFKKWFGNSLAEYNGVPMVFFQKSETFGSGGPETWAFDDAFLGSNVNHARTGLGHTFTPRQTQADMFKGTNRAFYLRLENPLILEAPKTEKWKSIDDAIAFANRAENLKGHDSIWIPEYRFIYIFDSNQAKLVENSGEFGETKDTRYAKEGGAGFTPDELNELLAGEGSITFLRNKKPDSTFLDRVFSTPEYYFKKFAAAGRVLSAALARRDIRYTTEQKILGGFVKYIQKLRKTNMAAFEEANGYLLDTDREADGYRIKSSEDDDSWKVVAPKWAVAAGENKEVGNYSDEAEAIRAMIKAEGEAMGKVGYSRAAIEAVRMARELTNEGFNIMAADMRRIIQEAKENGQPDPFVGDGQIDEAGRFAIYAAGSKRPIALFATQEEAEERLKQAAEMISYVVQSKKGGERSFKSELAAKRWAAKHSGTVKGQPMFQNLVVKKRTNAEMRPLTVKQALAQMGDLRGIYFPRIRETGEYVLIARRDGQNPIRKHFDIPTVGDNKPTLQKVLAYTTPIGREARRLKAMGYTVTIKKDDSPAEDVFEATNLISSLDAILQDSMQAIDKNDDIQVKSGQLINQILTLQIADIFKARGYLSSRIRRLDGDELWEGYEEDMGKALTQYAKNVAAGTAKRETAKAMILAFTGRDYSWADYKREVAEPDWDEYQEIVEKRRIDPRTQKNLFRDARNFIVDVLRNQDQADRIMGTMKGLAVQKFLGFRVSSAAVNITNMVQGVPATISGHTGESLTKAFGRVTEAATAYSKYRKSISEYGKYIPISDKISAEDRDIFEHISAMGWDEAQYNQEAASELRSKVGDAWNKYITASMFLFSATEKANRAMTLFAAYKAVKEKMQAADPTAWNDAKNDTAWEKAHEISDRAHGVYGKETLPAWARGKFNPLRLTYTFQKFSHNYMLNMLDLGFSKKEYKAASYLLLSPALLAGAGASLAGPALFALAGVFGLGGDDPEEEYYKRMEELFGAGEFARHGIFGVAGINIKGSLSVNLPMPADIGKAKLTDLAGPAGGVVTDSLQGLAHLAKGEMAKGVELLLPTAFGSMSKAVREGGEGVTTGSYGTVFYGNEPLKADTMDAFLRFLSFNPARLSGIREQQWHEKEVAASYQEEKTRINSEIKRLVLQGQGLTPEILKTIKVYNDRVAGSGRPDISPITPKSIHQLLRRNGRPSKFERMRVVND